ncbi:MAG: hypothetical protein COV57_00230 [Candidatus Liptonbacteria bacterium CG11_big_fil_rev_8_21_14_0_20_35_14]|uniref:YprB ribonuclease H-like domain-containing protein n=1 Tax=Candidatus Liptonbacteria bacterium CG11_big_fil_rev_8_21_14_0_20_35_14 TaxID=1974634 RepID=A0A2H0N8L1_9BACT|nr:MAG: hypothetical protein COV57_00230 [Candidatus Liptonbacteria bacterium CG11_big_fil_rev_8_21_14_0_20_35_14]
MDKVVLDIETKNTFADVGGQQNLRMLDMSFVGIYSYDKDKYLSFFEKDFNKLSEFFNNVGLIIGFASNRFDVPILDKYVSCDLFSIHRVDILDEIEMASGRRIGLDLLASVNLGIGKSADGMKAVQFYKEDKLKELQDYCIQDVKVTKDLYDLAKKRGYLLVPDKFTGENIQIDLSFDEGEMIIQQNLF